MLKTEDPVLPQADKGLLIELLRTLLRRHDAVARELVT